MNETVVCENHQGNRVKKACCADPHPPSYLPGFLAVPIWIDLDPKTGACPNATIIESGACAGSALIRQPKRENGAWVGDAESAAAAQASFDKCIARKKKRCELLNGTFVPQGQPKSVASRDLITVEQKYICVAN
jgi:hypothetical protein